MTREFDMDESYELRPADAHDGDEFLDEAIENSWRERRKLDDEILI